MTASWIRLGAAVAASVGIAIPTSAAAAAPATVSPGSLEQFAMIADRCPSFSWGAVAGVESYELVVTRVAEEWAEENPGKRDAAPLLRREIPGSALSWTPALAECPVPGGRYAWSVRAVGKDVAVDERAWSEARLFTIRAAPSVADVKEALSVLRLYLDSVRGSSEEIDQTLTDLTAIESTDKPAASDEVAELAKPTINAVVDPGTETTALFRDDNGDNFGVLVDSLAASGSEIGLHAGPSRYSSLAKNGYFLGGWKRFDEAFGAFLQEVFPSGEVTFNVVPAGPNPIIWNKAMHFGSDGKVGVGTSPYSLARFHSFGGDSLHGVSGSTNNSASAGVFGSTTVANASGVFGIHSGSSGLAYGVRGQSSSSEGTGVVGSAAAAAGVTTGVHGSSNSTSGRGVFGEGNGFSGANIGVLGRSNSADGYAIYGEAQFGNYAGYFTGKTRVESALEIGPTGDMVTLTFETTTNTLSADQSLRLTGDLTADQVILLNGETVSNGADGTVTVGADYLQIPTTSTVPGARDCTTAGLGRMTFETTNNLLYICGTSGWTTPTP